MMSLGLLILRVGVGSLMLFGHGWGKLQGFSQNAAQFPDPIGLGPQFSMAMAIFAEVFCSFLVIIGFKTRYAVIPLIITMLVAILVIHSADPFAKKEFALLFAIPFITLFFTGGGDYSVENIVLKKRT